MKLKKLVKGKNYEFKNNEIEYMIEQVLPFFNYST
jgi:hypothetical protein